VAAASSTEEGYSGPVTGYRAGSTERITSDGCYPDLFGEHVEHVRFAHPPGPDTIGAMIVVLSINK
jgi:hypothetical protein